MRGGARGTWRAEARTGSAPAPGRGAPRNCAGTPCAAARGPACRRLPDCSGTRLRTARRVARGCPGPDPWPRLALRRPARGPSGRCRTARDGYGIHPHSAEPAGVREEVRARDRSASRAGWLTRRRRPAGQAVAPGGRADRSRLPPGGAARRASDRASPRAVHGGTPSLRPVTGCRRSRPTPRPPQGTRAAPGALLAGCRRIPGPARRPQPRRAARRAPRRACAHSEQFKNRDGRRPPAR